MKHLRFYNEFIFNYKFKSETLENKVNCVIEYYNNRYKNDTNEVDYGANFRRAYEECINNI